MLNAPYTIKDRVVPMWSYFHLPCYCID